MTKKYLLLGFLLIHLSTWAQEYWKDFFFMIDPLGFDNPPYLSMRLSRDQALNLGSYTEVIKEDGLILEALTYVANQPEYFYVFLYGDEKQPLLRRAYYVDDFLTLIPLHDLIFYYKNNELFAVSFFEFNIFDHNVRVRQFTKLSNDGAWILVDSFNQNQFETLWKEMEGQELLLMESIPQYQSLLLEIAVE